MYLAQSPNGRWRRTMALSNWGVQRARKTRRMTPRRTDPMAMRKRDIKMTIM